MRPICIVQACGRPARKHDLCFKHHKQVAGDLLELRTKLRVPKGGLPTADQTRELLRYEPDTGAFFWKLKNRRIRPGDPAGSFDGRYVRISISNRPYQAHRIAFLIMTGAWPPSLMDHRNGVKDDNRWENIRPADPTINAQNVRIASKRNKLGVLGVSLSIRGGYKATIQVNGKSIHLGYHLTPEAAHAAYVFAKRILHEGNTL